jgi:hypothetical protein
MRKCIIVQRIGVARCRVYRAKIQIIDEETGSIEKEITKEYPNRQRKYVQGASLEFAFEEARELGFDHVERIESTEGEINRQLYEGENEND